jgi:TonB family protein
VIPVVDVDTPPKLTFQAPPVYTREAARQQIQGFVTVQFVIEADGTVGPIRVVRSLDAASGIDDAAVASVKRWRFTPGIKDGAAVRVLANGTVTFSLSRERPPISLPEGFTEAPPLDPSWSKHEVATGGFTVRFYSPPDWERGQMPALAAMMSEPGGPRSFGIYPPAKIPIPPPFPMPAGPLRRFAESMRSTFSSTQKPAKVLAVGQSPFGTHNWLWLELDMDDNARAWSFHTFIDNQAIVVLCNVMTPRLRLTETERDAVISDMRTTCANVIRGVAISR